ncbi:MAG: hypothetical protein K8T91_27335 [Planctomycetes bacterium]|nr:hypothetical protein [Planctomycetota bacterium]
MTSRIPVVRQMSWAGLVFFAACLGLCVLLGILIDPTRGALFGLAIFYLWFLCVSRLIARHHHAAVRLAKKKQFEQAIEEYRQSLAFFERNTWIDRFRFVVMFSLSSISYREMDLLGVAFCYGQIGDGTRSLATYRQCLEEFPDSEMAASALRLLDSVRKLPKEQA